MPIAITQAPSLFKDVGALCILTFFLLVPFAAKPFHIDDPLYVWTAQHLHAQPLEFYGFNINWNGFDQPVNQFFQNPPLTSYLLAGLAFLVGFNPLGLHLGFLVFNLLSIIGMYLLAQRFCRRPMLAALLLLFCPAFLVSATTVMCEPLLNCFWIWAVYLWIVGSENRPAYLLMAAVIMLLAVVTKFLAIAIVPLLIVYSLFRRSGKSTQLIQALVLIIPVGGAIAYEAFTMHHYGVGGFAGALSYVNGSHAKIGASIIVKLSNTFCFVGGCAAAAVFILPLIFPRWVTTLCILGILFLAAFAAGLFLPPEAWRGPVPTGSHAVATTFHPGFGLYVQDAFWTIGGLAISIFAILQLRRSMIQKSWNCEAFLFLWMLGIFIFTAFVNWSINGRSLLPFLPPVCILIVRGLDSIPTLPKFKLTLLLLLSAVLSLSVTRSDYDLASTCKLAATQVTQAARSEMPKSNTQLWFTGHWGFQYYMQATGALPVDDVNPQFKPGDIVIFPASPYGGVPGGSGFHFIRRIQVGPSHWLANTQTDMGADFYCSYGYGLPFVFAPIPPEAFDLVQVTSRSRLYP